MQLCAGSISDRELTVRSGLLNLPFSRGDVVIADKGFTMERHECLMIFCFLIRGPFLIIFGAVVAIISASDLILGSLSKVLRTFHIIPGVHAIILTANRFILGAFAIIFGA